MLRHNEFPPTPWTSPLWSWRFTAPCSHGSTFSFVSNFFYIRNKIPAAKPRLPSVPFLTCSPINGADVVEFKKLKLTKQKILNKIVSKAGMIQAGQRCAITGPLSSQSIMSKVLPLSSRSITSKVLPLLPAALIVIHSTSLPPGTSTGTFTSA